MNIILALEVNCILASVHIQMHIIVILPAELFATKLTGVLDAQMVMHQVVNQPMSPRKLLLTFGTRWLS